jgi:hypothetical protein
MEIGTNGGRAVNSLVKIHHCTNNKYYRESHGKFAGVLTEVSKEEFDSCKLK